MFDSLTLRNFQRWKKLKIVLEQITNIVGPSDAGKSAIIRALRWVCLNELTKGFQKHGYSNTSVNLRFGKHSLVRKRTPHGNSYIIDGKRLDAVRSDVPPAVAKRLSLSPNSFQSQHDSPYWLSSSASEVSRQLNSIIDLGIIDSTLSNLAKEVRRAHSTHNITEQRFEAAKEEVAELTWIEKCQEEFEDLEVIQKQYLLKQQSRTGLASLQADIERHKRRAEHNGQVLGLAQAAYAASELATQKSRKSHSLSVLVRKLKQATVASRLEVPKLGKLGTVIKQRTQLESLIDQIKTQEKQRWQIQNRLDEVTQTLKQQRRCPLCGQKVRQ